MLSYAGQPLSLNPIDIGTDPPSESTWIRDKLDPEEIMEFTLRGWPGKGLDHLGWYGLLRRRRIEVGTLRWPWSAARFALGHFLADNDQLAAIRQVVYANGNYSPSTLVYDDGHSATSFTLWMLPPRPLAQDGLSGLWLLSLVDARYFWWFRAGDITVTEGTTTWQQLYQSIAAALGVTISVDTIPSAYLKPPGILTTHYRALPILLDAVAACVGQRIVAGYDGSTFRAMNPTVARDSFLAQASIGDPLAGGIASPSDDKPRLPASVTVAFPRTDAGIPAGTDTPYTVTLQSLALPDVLERKGFTGSKVFHSTAPADFQGGGTPTNDAELQALAKQTATDYYRWTAFSLFFQAWRGVLTYLPDGLHDLTWVHGADATSERIGILTRIEPSPLTIDLSDLHHLSHDSTARLSLDIRYESAEYKDFLYLKKRLWLAGGLYLSWWTYITWTTSKNDFPLLTVVKHRISSTVPVNLTGLLPDDTTLSTYAILENVGSSTITLTDQDSASSASNRFSLPGVSTIPLNPGKTLEIEYDVPLLRWTIIGGTAISTSTDYWYPAFYTWPQWTTDKHNLSLISNVFKQRISSDMTRTLTGIVPNAPTGQSQIVLWENVGANPIVFAHENALSSAGNRLHLSPGEDITVAGGYSLWTQYDPLQNRWVDIGGSAEGVTTIIPGSGISVDQSHGAVTITWTGSTGLNPFVITPHFELLLGDTDDWGPSTDVPVFFLFVDPTVTGADIRLTGRVNPGPAFAGKIMVLKYIGLSSGGGFSPTGSVTVMNEDPGSASGNRFQTSDQQNRKILPGYSIWFIYAETEVPGFGAQFRWCEIGEDAISGTGITSGVVGTNVGGTGQTFYNPGDMLYGALGFPPATQQLDILPAGTEGQTLQMHDGKPTWVDKWVELQFTVSWDDPELIDNPPDRDDWNGQDVYHAQKTLFKLPPKAMILTIVAKMEEQFIVEETVPVPTPPDTGYHTFLNVGFTGDATLGPPFHEWIDGYDLYDPSGAGAGNFVGNNGTALPLPMIGPGNSSISNNSDFVSPVPLVMGPQNQDPPTGVDITALLYFIPGFPPGMPGFPDHTRGWPQGKVRIWVLYYQFYDEGPP